MSGSLTLTVGSANAPASPDSAIQPDNMEIRQELIRLINQTRKANGVSELPVSEALMNAAQVCSNRRYTWHHSQEECQAAADAGYPYGFGDNLTVFTGTEDAAQHALPEGPAQADGVGGGQPGGRACRFRSRAGPLCTDEKYPFLHRIRALRDIGSEIKAGDLGGFVESEGNLSFEAEEPVTLLPSEQDMIVGLMEEACQKDMGRSLRDTWADHHPAINRKDLCGKKHGRIQHER